MTKETLNFSEEEIKQIQHNAPKDPELTGDRTAYFFRIAKDRMKNLEFHSEKYFKDIKQ